MHMAYLRKISVLEKGMREVVRIATVLRLLCEGEREMRRVPKT